MLPQPMLRSEVHPDDSHPDPTRTLEQHILAGFPPDLALDLVLNEIVVHAAEATRAAAAALALARGDEMIYRAATGPLAPDIGVPVSTRDGLAGACLRTRQTQLSVDTDLDPRLGTALPGIRSILIVPLFDTNDNQAPIGGILEVFSQLPAAFSAIDQKMLERFAEECARVRHAAIALGQRKPAAAVLAPDLVIPSGFVPSEFAVPAPPPASRPYEAWSLVLGSLAILAIVFVSMLIGSRVGWLHPAASHAQGSQPVPPNPVLAEPVNVAPIQPIITKSVDRRSTPAAPEKATGPTPVTAGELVVYDKGKVIFRMMPGSTKPDHGKSRQVPPDPIKPPGAAVVAASSTQKVASSQSVWLAAGQAETRLLNRTEPKYPSAAQVARRAGEVILEVQVAEDGSVSSIHIVSGDPLLAAAATDAVRTWRYEPYVLNGRPSPFTTNVTLSFVLPD